MKRPLCTFILVLQLALSTNVQADNSALSFVQRHYGSDYQIVPSDALLLRFLEKNSTQEHNIAQIASNKELPKHLRLDAARSLAYFAKSPTNIQIAADTMISADFKKLDPSEWFFLCQKLAQRGANVLSCVRKILQEPQFEFPLMGTGAKLDKPKLLTFLLLNMPQEKWNRWAQDHLWRGTYSNTPSSEEALAYALFYSVSLRADAILAKIVSDPTRSESLRTYCSNLLLQMRSMERWSSEDTQNLKTKALYQELGISERLTEIQLREARQMIAQELSVLNITRLEQITFLIRSKALEYWKELQQKGQL